jgi:hypothetical protein
MFIDSGRHSLILSGNVMWWQIRYSDDGTQMLCYKHIKDPVKDVQYYTTNWFERVLKYPIENSFGMNFNLGGYGISSGVGWHGYKIVNESSPLLVGTGLKNGDIISCPSNEYDGAPIKYIPGQDDPVLDNIYNFHKIEMIGYDHSFRVVKTAGTFIALQKTETSGVIVNTASTDWCAKTGLEGKDGDKLKLITINAINLLLENESVFSSST